MWLLGLKESSEIFGHLWIWLTPLKNPYGLGKNFQPLKKGMQV